MQLLLRTLPLYSLQRLTLKYIADDINADVSAVTVHIRHYHTVCLQLVLYFGLHTEQQGQETAGDAFLSVVASGEPRRKAGAA